MLSYISKQVLIFSQWTKILDIMDYYFSEKGFEVFRIDGSVKLDERKRQASGKSIKYLNFLHFQDTCYIFNFYFSILTRISLVAESRLLTWLEHLDL